MTLTNSQISIILYLLSRWGDGDYMELGDRSKGFCPNLCAWLRVHLPFEKNNSLLENCLVDFFQPYFKSWENYSGDIRYPVPDPESTNKLSRCAPKKAYDAFEDLWGDSKYANFRRELCRHIVDKFIERALKNVTE